MTDIVEERLRTAFEHVTTPVVPHPDPLGRLLVRRDRRRWRRALGAVAAAGAVVLAGGTVATAPSGSPIGPEPAPQRSRYAVDASGNVLPDAATFPSPALMTGWTRRLIDAPVRGNLARDGDYVEALTRALERESGYADPAQNRVKVLAVTDVGGARVAVTARYNDTHATVQLGRAAKDAGPEDLAGMMLGGMSGPLQPFFFDSSGLHHSRTDVEFVTTIALAPAGCDLESSDTTMIDADGTPHRTWQRHGDHLIVAGDTYHRWWRVTCDGTVRYQAPADYGLNRANTGTAPPAGPARGSADPATVSKAVENWHAATRHLGGTAPTVVWAGTPAGGAPTVVVAGRAPSGRVLVTALGGVPALRDPIGAAVYYQGRRPASLVEPPPPPDTVTWVPVTTATAASTDLVAVRLAAGDDPTIIGDRLLVIAPPAATKLTITSGGTEVHAPVTLSDGVGVVTVPSPATGLDLRALDAAGGVQAESRFSEPDADGQFLGEPVIEKW